MADIQMCTGVKTVPGLRGQICPKREQCYRYTATPGSSWQSYGPTPFQMYQGQVVCRDFWNKDER